jgi:dipeptidyl aminopeptidase/acylaminoacyl peptidase
MAVFCFAGCGPAGPELRDPSMKPGRKIDESQMISVDDLLYMESVTEQAVSPGGASAAWVKTGYAEGNEAPLFTLYITSVDDMITKQFTGSEFMSISGIKWSPPGRDIAFLGVTAESGAQVWSVEPESGGVNQLTEVPGGIEDFGWAGPEAILYTAMDGAEQETADEEDDTIHVTQYVETPVRLFRLELTGGRTERLTDNDDTILAFSVSPDGKVAFLCRAKAASAKSQYYQDIPFRYYTYDIDSSEETQIFSGVEAVENWAWSPDSETLLATEAFVEDEYVFAYVDNLLQYDTSSGDEKIVDLGWERGLMQMSKVSPTNEGFIAILEDGCHPKLARYVMDGNGYERRIMEAEHQGNIFSIEATPDGKTVFYQHSTASKPTQWYVATVDGDRVKDPRPYTDLNPQYKGKTFAGAEAITWEGARGEAVEGMLYYPADYNPEKKYPLMLNIHGGPLDCTRDRWALLGWMFPYHLITQKGAFVLDPNYHGSYGYGLGFSRSIRDGKVYEYPVEDIEKGIDRLVELGIVDEDRLGTMGWSQGSVLSNALIAHDQRFKVASCGAGGAEWISYWGQSYVGYSFCEYYLGASPIENPDLYKNPKLAPFYDADKVETPVILFIGSEDQNVPPCQVWITYRGIQKYGSGPVELYVFPGEPHVLQKLSHQNRKMVEEQKWFDKYFFGTGDDQ